MKKTWIITGAHTGFGKSLALLLAQQDNVNLVVGARHPETDLDYLNQYDHGQIQKTRLDVTDATQIKETVNVAMDVYNRIDVLVNNAGIGYLANFEESDLTKVQHMFDVNVWGLVNMTRAVLPIMRQQKAGAIINLSSMSGLNAFQDVSFYTGTKFAVEGISRSLAKEVAPLGIKVMLVEPSAFRTNWAASASKVGHLSELEDYQTLNEQIKAMTVRAHHEAGDPDRAANIIYDQVTNHFDELPLHLPLGSRCVEGTLETLHTTLDQFEKMKDLAAQADFDDEDK